MSTTLKWIFGGVTFQVDNVPVVEGYGELVDRDVARRAERAVALAALESDVFTGAVAKFAREALGLSIDDLAARGEVPPWCITNNESMRGGISRSWPLAVVKSMLYASDRGGFVAHRVTP